MTATNPSETIEQPAEQLEQLDKAIRARRCLRCGGNLFLSRGNGAGEWTCLQCGRAYPRTARVRQTAGLRRPTRWTA